MKIEKNAKLLKYILIAVHCAIGLSIWLVQTTVKMGGNMLPVLREDAIGVSALAEHIVSMVIAAGIGVCIIVVVWNAIVWGIKHSWKLSLGIIVSSAIIAILVTPLNYTMEMDNAGLYVLAIEGYADYWNGFYQSVLYQASLVVLYHPATIVFLQSAAFLTTIVYLGARIKKIYGGKWYWFVLIIFLFPSTFDVMVNPYRNNVNTILCLAYVGILVLDCMEQKRRTLKECILLSVALGSMSVFRTENVFLVILLIASFAWNYQIKAKKILLAVCVCIVCFAIMSVPQKIGDSKYYGKDYMIINQMNTLRFVLEHPQKNMTYEQCDEDISTIHEFANLEGILQGGLDGYRARRYEAIQSPNQSLKSKEEQQEFLMACYDLYLHNIPVYLKDRYEVFLESNAFGFRQKYVDEKTSAFYQSVKENFLLNYTIAEFDTKQCGLWKNPFREKIAYYFFSVGSKYMAITLQTSVWAFLRVVNYILLLGLLVAANVFLKRNRCVFNGLGLSIIATMMSVFLFEPEGRMVYFTPVSYLIALFNFVVILEIIKQKHNMKYIDEK